MAPRSNAIGKLREIIEQEGDPKEVLLSSIGDLSNCPVARSQVLVATHAGEKFHAGTKILRTDKDLVEQQYQGSVGLVVKLGLGAFENARNLDFHGFKANIGDWVLTRPADGLQLYINQVPCRLFDDVNILMLVDDPQRFW